GASSGNWANRSGHRPVMRLESARADLMPGGSVAAPRAATAPAGVAGRLTFRTFSSVSAIARGAWERMLPGEPESWDFYAAVESVPPPGFKLGAVAALDGDHIVAAAPLFRVAYRIDTPLQGRLRQITDWEIGRASCRERVERTEVG